MYSNDKRPSTNEAMIHVLHEPLRREYEMQSFGVPRSGFAIGWMNAD